MKIYYCKYLDLNVSLSYINHPDYLEVLMFDFDNGVLLFPVTMNFISFYNNCSYVNTVEYPWLYEFLVANNIASPTYTSICCNGETFYEFKFLEVDNYE